jgi:cardiolipin synthase
MVTVPNVLTLFRILTTPVIVWLLLESRLAWAFYLFCLSGVTDALDGFIARVFDQRSRLGAYLDPLADKLLAVSAFVFLARLALVPNWLAVIVVSRDAIILLGVFTLKFFHMPLEINPSIVSKFTTLLQLGTAAYILAQSVIFLPDWGLHVLFPLVGVLTVVSGFHYIYVGAKLWEEHRGEDDGR